MRPMSGRFRLCVRQHAAEREGFEPCRWSAWVPLMCQRGDSPGGALVAAWGRHGGNLARPDHRPRFGFLYQNGMRNARHYVCITPVRETARDILRPSHRKGVNSK